MSKNIDHPNPPLKFAILAADTVLFVIKDNMLFVRLNRIDRAPYFVNIKGLPGGLLGVDETAPLAALRHLKTKTDISTASLYVEQLYTFSAVDRDPRGRVVAVAYLALVPWESLSPGEQEGNEESVWIPVSDVPKLAYDHNEVLDMAITRLRSRITYTSLIAKLLPREFTLTELEEAYECILGKDIDKRNFRKKIEKLDLLLPLSRFRAGTRSRPARLYKFRSKEVKEIEIL